MLENLKKKNNKKKCRKNQRKIPTWNVGKTRERNMQKTDKKTSK